MTEIPCPDGYLLDARSPLADGHHALNAYLVAVEEKGWKPALRQLNGLRDQRLKIRVWMALLERLAWLREHGNPQPYFKQLHDVTYSIEEWTLSPTREELMAVLQQTGALAGAVAPFAPMPHLLRCVEEHGLTPELAAAIRGFDAAARGADFYVNQTRLQMFQSRLDMLAWQDEWTPIDLKRCWSEQIRSDFRAMRGGEREHWRRLVHSIHGDEGVHPAPSWMSKAQEILGAIGRPEAAARLLGWFNPLRRGCPVRLSREGSFVLRCLLWLVPSLENPELAGLAGEIPEVAFKPRKNGDKVIRCAAELAGLKLVSPPVKAAPSLDAITGHALATVLSPMAWGSSAPEFTRRVRVEGEIVHVEGRLNAYRVHISTGAVFRESDGRRLRVESDAVLPAELTRARFGGIAEMLTQIVVLAEDWKHEGAITDAEELL